MRSSPGRWLLCVFLGLTGGASWAASNQAEKPASVIAVQVKGTVEVQHGTAPGTEPVTDGTQLVKDDTVTTAAQSSVMLVLPNGSVVALKEKSRLKISLALNSPAVGDALAATAVPAAEAPEAGVSQTGFELAFGQMLTRVRKLNPSSTFEVQTPVSVAAVRGTVFEVSYQPDVAGEAQYQLSTASGLVHVTPHAGQMVAVPADEQVDLAAEVGRQGVRIKHLKKGRLDRKKRERMDKEGRDNERNAGELIKRVQQLRAKAAEARTDARTGATNRVIKPTVPAKTKVPTRVPAVKRPPRRPGT